jgi:predicted DNA-binding transcriptional regulator AlpA
MRKSAAQLTATFLPRLLNYHQVQQLTGLSRTTIWRLCSEHSFPCAVILGSRTVRFRAVEVQAFCDGTWTLAAPAGEGVEL